MTIQPGTAQDLIAALKKCHNQCGTPGKLEHSIFGQAALLLEKFEQENITCKECENSYESISSDTGWRCKIWGSGPFFDPACYPDGYCHLRERRKQ